MADIIQLESTSTEKVRVVCRAPEDPTLSSVEFEVTSNDATSPTGSWSAGTWETTWNATTEKATALTPTVGASGTLVTAEGNWYKLWVRFSTTVIKHAATIHAT